MKRPHLWMRAESKALEERRALSPANAKALLDAGFQLTVERSSQSIFADAEYEQAGCVCVAEGSWASEAPRDAYVLGLKELPDSSQPLSHRHIYFAHAYKGQEGWRELLGRFEAGGGTLYDLEYLTDENGRRVAAFGFWAGFAGTAVAVQAWCAQQHGVTLRDLRSYKDQEAMIASLKEALGERRPSLMLIGALGRCGRGARKLADALDLKVTPWDIEETRGGGPFSEILEHDLFVNCVFVNRPIPPFLSRECLSKPERVLSVICDVSCDPSSEVNPLPIYRACTDFASPCNRLIDGPSPLDLIAIDHLPSLLPAESSDDFSSQLLPSLLQMQDDPDGVWQRAHDHFTSKVNQR